MKWSRLFILSVFAAVGLSCSDNDPKEQDGELDMEQVMNKNLYYNKWLNNKEAYTTEGMVEVVRFTSDCKLWNVDFGGKQEIFWGTWTADVKANTLEVVYENGENETWHVLDWKKGVFTVMVNGGKREYVSEGNKDVEYLQNLTGDAFLLTEIDREGSRTSLRIELEGSQTLNVKESKVILARNQVRELKYAGDQVMIEKEPIGEDVLKNLGMPGKGRDIIFYVNEGNGREFKFSDYVSEAGFAKVEYEAFDLRASNTSSNITVRWRNPYVDEDVCYQVEILSEDEKISYFKSDYLEKNRLFLDIDSNTKTMSGTLNDIRKLIEQGRGGKFMIRWSVVMLESGVPLTSNNSYINRQAVANVSVLQVLN
ncbi:MAG: hypothetical protein OSJ36_03820 [Odoribacter sp.]|nr:hypothetical protein [Odoribacter sp.]